MWKLACETACLALNPDLCELQAGHGLTSATRFYSLTLNVLTASGTLLSGKTRWLLQIGGIESG
jgi:hypothetical protein